MVNIKQKLEGLVATIRGSNSYKDDFALPTISNKT